MEVGEQGRGTAALPPGQRLDTQFTGGWVGPRAGVDGCGKLFLTTSTTPDHQPVTSRYTDWAILAHYILYKKYII